MKMPNILKMGKVEKRLLTGGLVNSLTYWGNKIVEQTWLDYPQELKNRVDAHLPTNGELVADLAPPAIFYLTKKVTKKKDTKEKMGDYGFGATLFAVPNLIAKTGSRALYVEGVAARPAARVAPVAKTKYAVTPPAARPALPKSMSKYIVTG